MVPMKPYLKTNKTTKLTRKIPEDTKEGIVKRVSLGPASEKAQIPQGSQGWDHRAGGLARGSVCSIRCCGSSDSLTQKCFLGALATGHLGQRARLQ